MPKPYINRIANQSRNISPIPIEFRILHENFRLRQRYNRIKPNRYILLRIV